jgi:RNA polymerase sigma-70 factor, ECF subfamily
MQVSPQAAGAGPDTEALWHEFGDQLLNFIARRVGSRVTAEDILQDVMLRIHRNASELERVEALGAWLHTIARNAITDHYRSASVRRETAAGDELDWEAAPEPEPDGPDHRAGLSACVLTLLKRVEPKYRQALELTEIEGMTQADAAERLGISVSGMKSRVQRGRTQLKGVLVECCEIELDRRRGVAGYRKRRNPCGCADS